MCRIFQIYTIDMIEVCRSRLPSAENKTKGGMRNMKHIHLDADEWLGNELLCLCKAKWYHWPEPTNQITKKLTFENPMKAASGEESTPTDFYPV